MSNSKQQSKKRALSTLIDHRQQNSNSNNNNNNSNINYNTQQQYFRDGYSNKENKAQQNQTGQQSQSMFKASNFIDNYNSKQLQKEQQLNSEQYTYQQKPHLNQQLDYIPQKIQCSVADTTTEIKWKELKEMDEEEMYIERLRQQRKKIDEIKGEFVQKVDYYNSIEVKLKELMKYKPYFEKYNQLKVIMEQTLDKLNKRESDYKCLKETHNLTKNEIKELQEKLVDSKKDNIKLLEDIEQRKLQNNQLQSQIRNMIKQENEIQYQLQAQREKFENLDQLFKQQMTQTKIENIKLYDNLNHFKQLNEQIITLRISKDELNITNQRLQQQIIEQQEENNKVKEEKNIIIKELQRKTSEIDDLKVKFQELEYNQIMINAKKSIIQEEFEQKQIRNESNVEELKQIIHDKQDELKKSRNLNQQNNQKAFKFEMINKIQFLNDLLQLKKRLLSVEYDTAVKKIKEFEHEIWEYRKENHNLKVKLSNILQGKGGVIIPNQRLVKEELDQLEKDIFSFKKAQMLQQSCDDRYSQNNLSNNNILQYEDFSNEYKYQKNGVKVQNMNQLPTQESNNNYYNAESTKFNTSDAHLFSHSSEQLQHLQQQQKLNKQFMNQYD